MNASYLSASDSLQLSPSAEPACRCGPCRAFTPTLAQVYQTVKSKHDDFAIVFVSADRNPQQFEVSRLNECLLLALLPSLL